MATEMGTVTGGTALNAGTMNRPTPAGTARWTIGVTTMDEVKPRLTLRNGRWTVKHQPGITYRPKALKDARWLAKRLNEWADEKRGIDVGMHSHSINMPPRATAQQVQQAWNTAFEQRAMPWTIKPHATLCGAAGYALDDQATRNALWSR